MLVLIIKAIAPFGCNWLHEPTRNGDKDYGCMQGCMRRCMKFSLAILHIICTKPAHPVEGPRDGTILFRPAQNQKSSSVHRNASSKPAANAILKAKLHAQHKYMLLLSTFLFARIKVLLKFHAEPIVNPEPILTPIVNPIVDLTPSLRRPWQARRLHADAEETWNTWLYKYLIALMSYTRVGN